jgi:hypothetical protein
MEAKMAKFELPGAAIDAMKLVYDGGYVYEVGVANLLMVVHYNYPELINIGMVPEDFPLERKPIFVAALTEQGKEYVDGLSSDKSRNDG